LNGWLDTELQINGSATNVRSPLQQPATFWPAIVAFCFGRTRGKYQEFSSENYAEDDSDWFAYLAKAPSNLM
jgi:hypothetical protein